MTYKQEKLSKRKQESAIRKKIYNEYINPTLIMQGKDPGNHAHVAKLLGNTNNEVRIEKSFGIPAGSMRKVRESNYSKLFVGNNPNSDKFKKKYENEGIDF